MKIALSAKVSIDRRRLLRSRWVHDTAHRLAATVRKARDEEENRPARRKH